MPSMTTLVDSNEFNRLIYERSQVLMANAAKLVCQGIENFTLTRPLLGFLHSEAAQMEELLDAYGARSNRRWYAFRVHMAMLKNFSTAGYELVHLKHTIHAYGFEKKHPAAAADTCAATRFVATYLFCAMKQLLDDGIALHWAQPEDIHAYDFSENLPPGLLPKDRTTTGNETAQQLVTRLATNFLNNTEDARFLEKAARCKAPEWRGLDFEELSEATIRMLEGKFHTLQSLYDTYISFSSIEGNDTTLRELRGHISIVLHLLRATTVFIHFYERHVKPQGTELFCHRNCVLQSDWYLEILTHYLCRYSCEFLDSARDICQRMLRRYAVVETMEVPAPPYFGFHVRPSTLISAIVLHYGSEVKLIIDREYDASLPMNLFRANEWLNQLKRAHVAKCLAEMDKALAEMQTRIDEGRLDRVEAVRQILRILAKQKIIRVKTYPLPVDGIIRGSTDSQLMELVQHVIANLQAQREIDIHFPVLVKFRGDVRVLNDIRILADNGYGENERGENVALPAALSYLSRNRPIAPNGLR